MSWNFFGSKKKESTTTAASTPRTASKADPGTSIVKLREAIATQEKREQHLERKIDSLTKEAKEKMAKKDKKGALFCLKRKKMYEAEVDKIQNVKMTLETQVMNLESAAQNAETFGAMKTGTDAMKKIRQDVGIEKVDDMMDDIREEMETANEISNAIAQPIDPLMTDEDELLAELEGLEQDDLEAELLKPTPAAKTEIDLPSVPSSKLPEVAGASKDEEEELRKLEAEIAGM
uniref:Uncharacterized protein n=1 Tax=Helicotheca tamesis TaxID=374047 RepID=A0A7S2I1T2_9STRA|mmetsp:Transcript_4673/g.6400  ORF Transcript_4673/g.6400 Transcript_4673/m.6400 type:complete len:233 (+) Transcript_4673:152-850(+)|eukprot:CAMPEP_0185726828 /NCGR_PEP_ID=MMETSP1171-20130828/2684_1 /TAXON_ID=374046 /ORGANISM="Helicotheca tamensis, Strain CCMP826" /LENGTH=232 /DNA_ID=CAMNT_0028395251 /DNA_START=137 /DNA_END=835 /DNA_ORIENTATION=-